MADAHGTIGFGVGQSAPRVEDRRLVTGAGRFTDDVRLPGAAQGYMLRAPHAHARIAKIDAARARKGKGVLAIYTASDLSAAGVKPIPSLTRAPPVAYKNSDGSDMPDAAYYPLARDKVRFAGEGVAFVVAETRAQAQDAAERVAVDYAPLDAVIDAEAALAAGAPRLWDELSDNRCFDWQQGDRAASEAIFAQAAHVTRLHLVNNRLVVAYLEPRACAATFDAATGRYTLYSGSQGAHRHKAMLAGVLGVAPEKVRAVSGDVGGAFGCRTFLYPEYALAAFAAARLGRPVKWRAERGEQFLSDQMARDQTMQAALALDADGRFLGLRIEADFNIGAYVASLAAYVIIVNEARMLANAYAVPDTYFRLRAAFTNCAPVNAYRGVGRAEAIYAFERLVDQAARETGIDRIELRRRNFIAPAAMPYTTPTGALYDSGEFRRVTDIAMAAHDWAGAAARKAAAARRGMLAGIGLAYYIEGAGGLPLEYAKLRAEADGSVTIFAGSQINGQGHETTFAQVAAERLGLPFDRIRVVQGDTALVEKGHGTFASRTMRMMGSAILGASELLLEKGAGLAGHLLEASVADIEYRAGSFGVRGTDRAVSLAEAAQAAAVDGIPAELRGELAGALEYKTGGVTYPNGCHVCELEVDPETGRVAVTRYTVADDVGRVINPAIVHGQVQGGVAQGIGQALLERTVYDRASGQLLSGSFLDYCLPRADDLPMIASTCHEVPCRTNPIGVKGAGEGGATGAPPAVINALLDALAPLGVRHIDMPATPEAVWRAIRAAGQSR
jgi:carbon-monoxide dehydrogenase large subunit